MNKKTNDDNDDHSSLDRVSGLWAENQGLRVVCLGVDP